MAPYADSRQGFYHGPAALSIAGAVRMRLDRSSRQVGEGRGTAELLRFWPEMLSRLLGVAGPVAGHAAGPPLFHQ